MTLEERVAELEHLFRSMDQLIHEHNMTKVACSCPPCDAWGKAQDEEDSAWRWRNVGPAKTGVETDADVPAGHMY